MHFQVNKSFNWFYWKVDLLFSSLTPYSLSSVFSVCCPGLHLQPLSSTSCLCKDPATVVVSIVNVQTPWCHDIHSLFPVPPEEAGGTKDYGMSFPEPFFCFVLLFFSPFCPTGAFFFSLSSCFLGSHPDFPWDVSLLIFTQVPLSHWGFYHHWFSSVRGRWDGDDLPFL